MDEEDSDPEIKKLAQAAKEVKSPPKTTKNEDAKSNKVEQDSNSFEDDEEEADDAVAATKTAETVAK